MQIMCLAWLSRIAQAEAGDKHLYGRLF